MPRVVIVYFDAGGGHRAAANAIQSVMSLQAESWDTSLLNLQEYLDEFDPVRKLTGVRLQDIYNGMLKRGSTGSMRGLLPLLHATVRLYTPRISKRLAEYWRYSRPDLVISVVPNLNRAIALSLRSGPHIPFVTVITDFADTPPHFWIERESEFLVCGTGRAVEQAWGMGHAPERVFRTSGMVLSPSFYNNKSDVSREVFRRRLSLSTHLTTILVMFGGQGSREMLQIAHALERCSTPIQTVYICGRNERLRAELESMHSRSSRVITGFTTEVPLYMAASDLMIGKPGPGSISEALHFGLPVIVSRNKKTMPQEVFNTHWVENHGVGVVVRDFDSVDSDVDSVIADGRLESMRSAAAQIRNRAIFEIPDVLRTILARVARTERLSKVQDHAGAGSSSIRPAATAETIVEECSSMSQNHNRAPLWSTVM